MIHLYIGDGKGKTTAAIGLGVRCAGSGAKVEILQFLKDGTSCENKSLENLNIKVTPCQRSSGFFWNMNDEQKKCLKNETDCGIDYAQKVLQGECCMLIMDEVLGAVENELVDLQRLIGLVKMYGGKKEIVLTGRKAPQELLELADYVSEIRKIKHPFDKGIEAKKGIEY